MNATGLPLSDTVPDHEPDLSEALTTEPLGAVPLSPFDLMVAPNHWPGFCPSQRYTSASAPDVTIPTAHSAASPVNVFGA